MAEEPDEGGLELTGPYIIAAFPDGLFAGPVTFAGNHGQERHCIVAAEMCKREADARFGDTTRLGKRIGVQLGPKEHLPPEDVILLVHFRDPQTIECYFDEGRAAQVYHLLSAAAVLHANGMGTIARNIAERQMAMALKQNEDARLGIQKPGKPQIEIVHG